MILKTREIHVHDLQWNRESTIGWVLIAPYLILEANVTTHDATTRLGPLTSFNFYLVVVKAPLGPDDPERWMHYGWQYWKMPRKLYPEDEKLWSGAACVVDYGRRIPVNRLKALLENKPDRM